MGMKKRMKVKPKPVATRTTTGSVLCCYAVVAVLAVLVLFAACLAGLEAYQSQPAVSVRTHGLQHLVKDQPTLNWKITTHMVGRVPVIAIDNFLPPSVAETMHTELYGGWNSSEWLYTTNVPNTNEKIRSRDRIPERRKLVLDALANDPRVFAYSKWELRRNASVFKRLRGYMESAQSAVAQELKVSLVGISDMFVSCFDDGDFLSFHQDGYSGSIAFVMTLAKTWTHNDGGLLQMCQGQAGCTDFVPRFNRLLLFRTRGGPVIPHQVTQVTLKTSETKKRFGLTGWYMDSNDLKDKTFMAEFKKMQ